jgi:hypothetical protein
MESQEQIIATIDNATIEQNWIYTVYITTHRIVGIYKCANNIISKYRAKKANTEKTYKTLDEKIQTSNINFVIPHTEIVQIHLFQFAFIRWIHIEINNIKEPLVISIKKEQIEAAKTALQKVYGERLKTK